MSNGRKICLYKGCDNKSSDSNRTLFKFPIDKERFLTWCINSGLELEGNVSVNEARYLCEKHFSVNYISQQSRRKMLVHTAVPNKWNEETTSNHSGNFNIVGTSVDKKRKSLHETREIEIIEQKKSPQAIILNHQKRIKLNDSNQLDESSMSLDNEKNDDLTCNNNSVLYEEILIPPTTKRTYKCLVVKQKNKGMKTINLNMNNNCPSEDKEEETFFLTEEGNISSTNIDTTEMKSSEAKAASSEISSQRSSEQFDSTSSISPESYSEFIFNQEMYVQMPKRVFEEVTDKLKAETAKYKNMLLQLKTQIDGIILNSNFS